MIGTDSYHIVIESAPDPDYRYCNISVTEIDPATAMPPAEPLRAKSLGKGIIRLFRQFDDESSPHDVVTPGDDTMVSIIGVPTYFTATDLLGFIGESYMSSITHIRILKSEKPNRFLVLIKFNDIVKTAEFQYHFNGKPFNSMEPETCHVIFVKSVRYDYRNDIKNDTLIPFLLTDPFTSPIASGPSSPVLSSSSHETLVELPTCPVCLERMDSTVTGLLTIPCQHTFHCLCLSKWTDDTCPICRYSNNFSNLKVKRSMRRPLQFARLQQGTSSSLLSDTINETSDHCAECSADTNLWICLICGNVGCDRYAPEQHSLKHFVNTGHCFAMELDTSRVWDYAGDNYVHRLVANEADGKIVELPEKSDGLQLKSEGSSTFDKVDEVGFEYSQLLISQLASQREYYEMLLNERSAPKSRRGSTLPEMKVSASADLDKKVDELSKQVAQLSTEVIPSLKNKIKSKDEKIKALADELNGSNMLNNGLSSKIEFLSKENEEVKSSNVDLQEQVKDLMFFLESREKFKDQPQDVKDGTILVQKPSSSRPRKSKRK